jgi:hypothetical protein
LSLNIDFTISNDFICAALQNNFNMIICDNNFSISFLLIGAFILKYLNLTYTETIHWLYTKLNIKNMSKNTINQLYLYFVEQTKSDN